MNIWSMDAYIVSAVRTPIASFRSSFAPLSAVDLGAAVTKEAVDRSGLSVEDIEETIVGNVLSAGLGQNVARQISIAAGLPLATQCVTVNKVCSSSMKAIIMGVQAIQIGYRNAVVAAGAESMSNVPFYLPRGEVPYGGVQLTDGVQRDGLTDAMENKAMGVCAEKTVKELGLTREQLDAYAIESYRRAEQAWKDGGFAKEVVPVSVPQRKKPPVVISEDEEFKRLIPSKVATLNPVFVKDGTGTITAANASSINDGAAACVLVSEQLMKRNKLKPIARFVAYQEAGLSPMDFTRAPSEAVKKLLKKVNADVDSISLWELNEAFAATVLAFIDELHVDPALVNIKGGAVALGHPLGASGARIVVTLANALGKGELGVAAICNGGGEACAVLIQGC